MSLRDKLSEIKEKGLADIDQANDLKKIKRN